jgi:hypothetical protein
LVFDEILMMQKIRKTNTLIYNLAKHFGGEFKNNALKISGLENECKNRPGI